MSRSALPEQIQVFRAPEMPGERYIRKMFDNFAARYDSFTFLIGMGQDRRLRRKALETVKPGMRVLDIACGTGDLTLLAATAVGSEGSVTGLDFSSQMLVHAKKKEEKGRTAAAGTIQWVLKSAQELPLGSRRFDRVVSAYALRNLYERIDTVLSGVLESLEPGGEIAFLDLTEPENPLLRAVYRFYMYVFVGLYGLILFGKEYPVPYLPDSAKRFFNSREFMGSLRKAGFQEVRRRSFMLGAITLYQACKKISTSY